MVGLLLAPWDWRLAACSLFQIVWAESHQPYCTANLDYKSVEDCLRCLSADKVRKRSSQDVVFLGHPLCGLSLTSPVICNLAVSLEMVLGLTATNAATWFCWTPAWCCPITQALSRSVKRGMPILGADTNRGGSRSSKQESIATI